MSTILKPLTLTPSTLPKPTPRFGHEGHEHDHTLGVDSAPKSSPKKKGSLVVPLFLLGAFGLFMTIFGSIGAMAINNIRQGITMVQTTPAEVSQNAIGTINVSMGPLHVKTTITNQKEVFAGSILMGKYNDQGEAFSAQGLKLGHADAQGNLYLAQLPGTPVAKLTEDGQFKLLVSSFANVQKINVSAPKLSLQEQAAAVLTLLSQQNQN